MDKIAVIVPHYHAPRKNNLSAIAYAAQNGTVKPTSVTIFNNNPDHRVDIKDITCVNSNLNYGCCIRYAIAFSTPADYYILHDDDLSLGRHSVEQLIDALREVPDRIVGMCGSTLGDLPTPYKNRHHFNAQKLQRSVDCDIVLGRVLAFTRGTLGRALNMICDVGLDVAWLHDDIPVSFSTRRKNRLLPLDCLELSTGGVGLEKQKSHYDIRDALTVRCMEVLGV